jgi:NAD(P)-dependent dehydrogenase (short-subunit alcohol dehydrogenase family)
MSMQLDLNGRIAMVTGASKGIGLAVVRTLAGEGARIVAVSRTSSPELEELGEAVVHVPADLAEPGGPARGVATALERFGRLDILVNNAGGPPPGTSMPVFGFLDRDDADWRAMLDFNLLSAVRACRAAIPAMLEGGGGAIVNVTSAHARVPSAVNVDYGAAKAALGNLTQALSEEFGPQGIRVNTVCPGPVLTPWWTEEGGAADILAAQTGSDRDTVLSTLVPEMMALTTGRLADPQEVADAVVMLSSPRAASTTGAELLVDGGLVKST